MIRTSISPNIFQGGYRVNVIPSEARATLDVRTHPDDDPERLLAEVRKIVNDPAIEVAWGQRDVRPSSSSAELDSEAFTAIEAGIKKHYDTVTLPTMSTGATDMAYLRAKGIQCFGVGPATDIEDGPKGFGAHSDQERILESELYRFVKFYYDVVLTLAQELVRVNSQAPNPKLQGIPNAQVPNKPPELKQVVFEFWRLVWHLAVGSALELGAWILGFVYSYLSASIGSTREARWAGMKPAPSATSAQHHDRGGQHQRIVSLHLIEDGLRRPSGPDGAHQPDGAADQRHHADLAEHHRPHAVRRGAKGHPQPDLAGALGDRIGEHAVEPDRREQRRQHREAGRHRADHPIEEDVVADLLLHGAEVLDRQVRIDARHQRAGWSG